MNVRVFGVLALSLGACSGSSVTSQSDHLIASNEAQRWGIFSYTVDGARATMFSEGGIELGQMAVSVPVADRRLLRFELADGTTDDIEIYRPKADGTFFAPISPVTAVSVTAADPALAPLLARFQVKLHVSDAARLAAEQVSPKTLSSTTMCRDGGTPGQPWTNTVPSGCVKSANTSLNCTNPSQLPATIPNDTGNGAVLTTWGYSTQLACLEGVSDFCNSTPGAGNYASTKCLNISGIWNAQCIGRYMLSQWIASCPRSSCGTSGDYDAVPRQDQCYDPGSCTFQQGGVTCTTYH